MVRQKKKNNEFSEGRGIFDVLEKAQNSPSMDRFCRKVFDCNILKITALIYKNS